MIQATVVVPADYHVDVFQLARNNFLFCGAAGPEAACTLGIGVLGWEESDFRIIVYGQGKDYFDKEKRSEEDLLRSG